MKLKELELLLNEKLNISIFVKCDASLNGVQVGNLDADINKIVVMVDASLEGFKFAAKEQADLIICHHGLFWGKPLAVKGSHYNRIKFLIENNIALYAAHLPLDSHMELGNNIGIAKAIGLENCEPFSFYKGNYIGVKGELAEPKSLNTIKSAIVGDNEPAFIVSGGKTEIKKVSIVSGGAPYSVYEAIEEGADLFITGDKSHEVYHTCIEDGINMISAGHYATETFGVKLLGKWLSEEHKLETIFIDLPTGA